MRKPMEPQDPMREAARIAEEIRALGEATCVGWESVLLRVKACLKAGDRRRGRDAED